MALNSSCPARPPGYDVVATEKRDAGGNLRIALGTSAVRLAKRQTESAVTAGETAPTTTEERK